VTCQQGEWPPRSRGRAAAWAATAIFLLAGIGQFYAVLHAAFGVNPPPANALIVAVLVGLLAVAAAAILLIRVGYWRERVPFEVGRTGAWWVAYAGLGGAILGFGGQMDDYLPARRARVRRGAPARPVLVRMHLLLGEGANVDAE
jgi:hypothetical protein